MTKPSPWVSELARVAVPLLFVSIVAAAVGGITTPLFFAMVLSAGLVIVVIRVLFPTGRLFPIAFASLIAVYAAIFSLFVEEMFRGVDAAFLVVGFCLPIVLFVVGCWLRRDQVRAVVALPAIRSERRGHEGGRLACARFLRWRGCHCAISHCRGACKYGHGVPWSHVRYWIDRTDRQPGGSHLSG